MAERWEDSPPPRRGGYDWPGIARKLQAKPGKWMLVAEGRARSVQEAINRGRIRVLRDDPRWTYRCETRNTTPDKKTADIWMTAERKKD